MAKRYLKIIRDGKGHQTELLQVPLKDGEQGNIQTLSAMIGIVKTDRLKEDLRRLVLQNIIGADSDGHFIGDEIARIFEFAQKQIAYHKDPVQVERVCDLWTILFGTENDKNYFPEGDCGIKSVFIATCLALVGIKSVFVVIKQDKNATSFNHIYNAVELPNGKLQYLDATPEDKPLGWETKSFEKYLVPIF